MDQIGIFLEDEIVVNLYDRQCMFNFGFQYFL